MKSKRQLSRGGIMMLAVLLAIGVAWAAPQLNISPLGYRLVQVTQVANQSKPTIDIAARAGILNRGDQALNVSANLSSSLSGVTILDGVVSFGDVPRTRVLPVTSRDTFALRAVLPATVNPKKPAQVYLYALSLLPKLSWSISCDNCGGNQAPVSDAGADQTVFVGSVVTLDGSASTDVDGNPLTYKWSFVSRPATSTAALSSTSVARPTFTVDQPGSFVLQLVVNDGQQDSAADTVTITTQNSAPVANAGVDQTVDLGERVQLDGTVSSDVDGDPLTYAWNLLSRPDTSVAMLVDPATSTPHFTPDVAGQYVVELVVDDGTAASLPDTVVITTRPANATPIANAGPDQTVPVGSTVQLDGSASTDPDAGDVLSFAWSLLSRPVDSTAILTAADSSQPSFTVDKPGDYVAQLIVSDGQASSTDTVLISTQNSPPTASAGTDQTVRAGSVVQLDGSQSADPDNDPLGFTWSLLNQPAGSIAQLSDPFAINPIFTADLPGLYTSQLIVNDGRSDSAPATVNTTATNTEPVAVDDIATTPRDTPVVIDVLGNDTDADNDPLVVESVTMPANGAAVIEGTQVRYTPNAGFVGEDTFDYTIGDGLGGTDTGGLTVTVTAVDDVVPTAVLDVSPNPAEVGASITLDGSGSSDVTPGKVVGYTFTLVSAPAGYVTSNGLTVGTPVGQDTASRTFVPNVAGSYALQLMVRDNGGNDSTAASATLTVISSDLAVAKTVSNATPTVGTNITFTVTLSNAGPSNASSVSVTDALPSGYAFVSASPTQGSYSNTAGAWTVGAVNSGVDATLTITATVLGTGNYTNTASLASSTPTDPNSANNSASVVVTPVPVVNPNVTVPDVTGQTQAAANAALIAADLMVGTITQESSATVPAGQVIRQSPAAGASVARGSAVNLVVSSGSTGPVLPPDPATVAPPTSPFETTTVFGSTAFLYSGTNPIQTGVAPGTIEERRVAVLRGRVLDVSRNPLPGVTVTIEGRPEFGQTLSRADGWFDLAANGGGLLAVNYRSDGYLPSQRQVSTPWQDFVVVEDVVLIEPDSRVTRIELENTTEIQVARGNPVSDADGARQATVLFAPGTQATMTMPDGSKQALTSLSVRASEYTVGEEGPARMPGPLPPTSGYTYAVDLTVDEALAAGATRVDFSQPVPFYVENFRNFPVGTQVPTAYYDRARTAWVPEPDGRVVRILAVAGGLAEVDSTGDGTADNGETIGMTVAERAALASTYSADTTLWRVPIAHFTPYDTNWPIVPPDNAIPPSNPDPATDDPQQAEEREARDERSCKTISGSSLIDCQQQRLREQIVIPGTPFSLHYASDRVPGYVASRKVEIPISGAVVSPSLQSIMLTIQVAGRVFTETFPAAPNQTYTFVWDGLNAYGRTVTGSTTAAIRIDYQYPGVYALTRELGRSFGTVTGTPIAGVDPAPTGYTSSQSIVVPLSRPLGSGNSLAMWSLSVQHSYMAVTGELFRGDGQRRQAQGYTLRTIAGNEFSGFSGDGGPATAASLGQTFGVAVAPDGSVLIADTGNGRIRRVGPDGIITTIAGTGTAGFSGDGGPATAARFNGAVGVALAPDGSVVIADANNHRVRRVGPDGIITTIAGTGTAGFSGDGEPATAASLSSPYGVAVAPDGGVLIADTGNSRIRRVGPDGIITTIAGTGTAGFSGDGGRAAAANLSSPYGVAVAPDGSVLIADTGNSRIRSNFGAVVGTSFETLVPSDAGEEIYVFDGAGRHLRTADTRTGSIRYAFDYDAEGRLAVVTDGDGNRTLIERDGAGEVTAVVAPDGQRGGVSRDRHDADRRAVSRELR
jgi:uncharacterized repeat protein (TIGR01451 family)